MIRFFIAPLLLASICCSVGAQNAAPSSHMVFDDDFEGDIIINEVRVPASGAALYTYYETLGWRGRGAGYAGLQVHPKARNFIFSIWDHKEHTAPIKAVYLGPGTEAVGFGGEGTGLKSWNFELGWETDTWYTLAARTWPVGDHTHFGFWCRSAKTQQWTHLVTMDVAVANATFRARTDAFLEDWLDSGKNTRTTQLRRGWKRKMNGSWFAFGRAKYSVNSWDLVEGKRSFNFRTNWNGGVASDDDGKFYFMDSGGAKTKAAVDNPSLHAIVRPEAAPGFEMLSLRDVEAEWNDKKIDVRWHVDSTTSPLFSYQITLHEKADGSDKPLATVRANTPQAREASIDPSGSKGHYVRIQCEDVFGNPSTPLVIRVDEIDRDSFQN